MGSVNLSVEDATALATRVLVEHGTSGVNAGCVARALGAAEIDGQPGHGLSRLPAYAAQSASGKVDGHAVPVTVEVLGLERIALLDQEVPAVKTKTTTTINSVDVEAIGWVNQKWEPLRQDFVAADDVLRLHEVLCFLRAYPDDAEVLDRVEAMLAGFEERPDLRRHAEELVNTGVAGTPIDYRFYWFTAAWLARRFPDELAVDWESFGP